MKVRYRLPFKTKFMLASLKLVRKEEEGGMPSLKALQLARRDFPEMFPFTWFLGRMPREIRKADQMIAVRDAEIRVRVYRHKEAAAGVRLPLIVNFHGGGWAVGNLQNNDYYCGHLARQVGAVVVSVDYRLAPEHKFPTAAHDAYDALCWAVREADALGIDPARVCVTGDSAGGNLAAVAALMARDLGGPAIRFQALLYPGTDSRLQYASLEKHAFAPILTKADIVNYLAMYMRNEDDRCHPWLSPFLAESLAGLPAAVVVTAGYDPLCDDGAAYAKRLQAEGTPCEWLHFPEDVHGFFTLPNHTQSCKAAIAAVAERILKGLS